MFQPASLLVLVLAQRDPFRLEADVTAAGCTCKSACGASVWQEYGRCDWCWTEGSCGRSSFGGHWDYCVYRPVASFDNQTSHEKMRQLWASITDPAAVNQSAPLKKADLSAVVEITGTSMITPFDDAFEVLPRKRRKVIHQQGAVCKFDLAVNAASNFTGVLSAGTQSGIIRLGNALPSATSFPGFGIKWPRRKRQLLEHDLLQPRDAAFGAAHAQQVPAGERLRLDGRPFERLQVPPGRLRRAHARLPLRAPLRAQRRGARALVGGAQGARGAARRAHRHSGRDETLRCLRLRLAPGQAAGRPPAGRRAPNEQPLLRLPFQRYGALLPPPAHGGGFRGGARVDCSDARALPRCCV